MHTTAEFPSPTRIGGRLMFDRHDVENHKRQLMGLTPVDRDPAAPIVLGPPGGPDNQWPIWEYGRLLALKKKFEDAGLNLAAIEGLVPMDEMKAGGPGRDAQQDAEDDSRDDSQQTVHPEID